VVVRWAVSDDAALPFVAAGIPTHVVASRVANRGIAVANIDGTPVGALQLEYLWGTRPYVAIIRVVLGQQRRGVGRSLLTFVESALRADGYQELLSSSQANEPEPQAWHRRMGFVTCGVIEAINEGGIDEIFFRKILTPSIGGDHRDRAASR
jgi:GNAT superfamily N-acetyltransferase